MFVVVRISSVWVLRLSSKDFKKKNRTQPLNMRVLTGMVRGRDKKGISFTTYHQPFPLAIEPEPLETTNASVQNILVCFVGSMWPAPMILRMAKMNHAENSGSLWTQIHVAGWKSSGLFEPCAGCIWLLTLFQGRTFHPWKDINKTRKERNLHWAAVFFWGNPPPFQIAYVTSLSARLGFPSISHCSPITQHQTSHTDGTSLRVQFLSCHNLMEQKDWSFEKLWSSWMIQWTIGIMQEKIVPSMSPIPLPKRLTV